MYIPAGSSFVTFAIVSIIFLWATAWKAELIKFVFVVSIVWNILLFISAFFAFQSTISREMSETFCLRIKLEKTAARRLVPVLLKEHFPYPIPSRWSPHQLEPLPNPKYFGYPKFELLGPNFSARQVISAWRNRFLRREVEIRNCETNFQIRDFQLNWVWSIERWKVEFESCQVQTPVFKQSSDR